MKTMAAIMLRSADALRMASERARIPAAVIAENQRAGGCARNLNVTLLRAANWLRIAAAPTFAVMALLVAVVGGSSQYAVRRGTRCVTFVRNGCDVLADERLSFGVLAYAPRNVGKAGS